VRFPADIVPLPIGPASASPPATLNAIPPEVVTESVRAVVPDETIVVAPLAATLNAAPPVEFNAEISDALVLAEVFCSFKTAPFALEVAALIAVVALPVTLRAVLAEELTVAAPEPVTEKRLFPLASTAEIRLPEAVAEVFCNFSNALPESCVEARVRPCVVRSSTVPV